ncbi:MAG: C10 family peptidase [Candidatus Delongbacteria bacterium]
MKLKILILIATSFLYSLSAVPVDKNEAEKVAKNWQKSFSSSEHLSIKSSKLLEDALYVINFEGGGFVLVAADDASKPVLGYSLSQSFDHNIDKSNVNYWTNMYISAIKEIRKEKLSNQKTRNQWDEILSDNLAKTPGEVTKLLSSTWNQSPIYNMYCPMDGNSLSVVGCVATAMAQIMNYHQYPLTGKDSHSYNILGQTLSVDYYLSSYNWDKMPDALSGSSTQEEAHEVAQISYHAGVAVEMMYSSTGSGAFSDDVPAALMNFFKYDSSISYESRNGYTTANWINMLKEQMDSSLPVYYSGSGDDGGHAFVCDGYDNSDYFHFNWGWGGSYDGYFQVDNLNPGGSTFNYGQAVVRNIIPKDYNLILQNPIGDMQSNEDTYQIDLSQYFVSLIGEDINYSVDPSSEIDGLQYEINGNILTLNKLHDGISKLMILANTRYDNSFDDFYFQFGSSPLLAGFGNAFNFNSSAYLDAGTSEISDTMEEISVSAWIKLDETGSDAGIISKASSSNTGWYVFLQNNNIVKFSVKTQDGLTRRIYSETALEADKWYHICAVYDGKDLMIYLDGRLDNIKTSYPERSGLLNETGEHITVGDTYGVKFGGIIDEATIWEGAISLPKIRESMSIRPDRNDESIISHWSFNEGF